MKELKNVISLLLVLLLLAGCQPLIFFSAGGAAGVMGYKYYKGGLIVVYKAPYAEVWDASIVALKKMGFDVEGSENDLASGEITAKQTDNTPVTITLEFETSETTKATIRVGLGDKESSVVIKERIQEILNQKH